MPLSNAFIKASPRLTRRAMPHASILLHATVACVVPVVLICALVSGSLLAWAAGIAYLAYDAMMMIFIVRYASAAPTGTPADTVAEGRPSLAVIIAAHNEAQALPATLAALFMQTDLPDLIVIADDGSTDRTGEWLENRYGFVRPHLGVLSDPAPGYPSLRWLRLPHGGKSTALNAVLPAITADIVLTIDGDTRLDPHAVAAMRHACARDPNLVAVGGIIIPARSGAWLGQLLGWFQAFEYIRNIVTRLAWAQAGSLLLVPGAFAGFRRDALISVGGFDPHALVEDYELIHRLHRYSAEHDLAWTVGIAGAAHAYTDAPHSVHAFLRQRRRWFGGFLQTQFWYRDMTGNKRFGRLGMWLLPVKLCDTLQPILGLTAAALLILFAIAGRLEIVVPALALIAIKIAIDIAFNRWAIRTYHRLTGDMTHAAGMQRDAAFAPIPMLFSFLPLRHTAECWGWLAFLSGQLNWEARRPQVADEPETT